MELKHKNKGDLRLFGKVTIPRYILDKIGDIGEIPSPNSGNSMPSLEVLEKIHDRLTSDQELKNEVKEIVQSYSDQLNSSESDFVDVFFKAMDMHETRLNIKKKEPVVIAGKLQPLPISIEELKRMVKEDEWQNLRKGKDIYQRIPHDTDLLIKKGGYGVFESTNPQSNGLKSMLYDVHDLTFVRF